MVRILSDFIRCALPLPTKRFLFCVTICLSIFNVNGSKVDYMKCSQWGGYYEPDGTKCKSHKHCFWHNDECKTKCGFVQNSSTCNNDDRCEWYKDPYNGLQKCGVKCSQWGGYNEPDGTKCNSHKHCVWQDDECKLKCEMKCSQWGGYWEPNGTKCKSHKHCFWHNDECKTKCAFVQNSSMCNNDDRCEWYKNPYNGLQKCGVKCSQWGGYNEPNGTKCNSHKHCFWYDDECKRKFLVDGQPQKAPENETRKENIIGACIVIGIVIAAAVICFKSRSQIHDTADGADDIFSSL